MRSGTKQGTARGQPALPEGTASPAHGGLGATIWRARQPLPRGSARVRAWRRGRPILRSNKHKYPEIIHGSGDLSDASSAAADQIRAAVNWPAAGGAGSGRRVWIPPSSLPPSVPASRCSCTCGGAGTGMAAWAGWAGILGVPLACTPGSGQGGIPGTHPRRGGDGSCHLRCALVN